MDSTVNRCITGLHEYLQQNPLSFITETVPAYCSLAVFIDACKLSIQGDSLLQLVRKKIDDSLAVVFQQHKLYEGRHHIIPVQYGGESGPDLEWVAAYINCTTDEVIAMHASQTYRVFMMGFQPGFAYMGITPPPLHVPRKDKPALLVKAGSVGLAGNQTGIYPADSPGGWQIIGQTEITLFDPGKENPFLLKAGDSVTFQPVCL